MRPIAAIEQAELLLGSAATRAEGLRRLAGAALVRKHGAFAAAVMNALQEIEPLTDADEIVRARGALLDERYGEARLATLSEAASAAELAEMALIQAAAALQAGDRRTALVLLQAAPRAGLEPDLARRLDWARTYVEAGTKSEGSGGVFSTRAIACRWASAPADRAPTFALLDYKSPDLVKSSINIGDYIQTLAAMRQLTRFAGLEWRTPTSGLSDMMRRSAATWLPDARIAAAGEANLVVLDRDISWPAASLYGDRDIWVILNGWFNHRAFEVGSPFPMADNVRPILVSVHLSRPQDLTAERIAFFARFAPVGCRDWTTVDWLLNAGVDAFHSGCLTLTLAAAPASSRVERCRVDVAEDRASDWSIVTHIRTALRLMSFDDALAEAFDLLDRYAAAAAVTTSRLHCYLPCRALGTSAEFEPKLAADHRFDGLAPATDDEVASIRDGLQEKLGTILSAAVAGRTPHEVYTTWRDICANDVAKAKARLQAAVDPTAPRPGRRPGLAVAARQRPTDVTIALSFDDLLLSRVTPLLRSIRANTKANISLVALTRGLAGPQLIDAFAIAEPVATRVFAMDRRLVDTAIALAGPTTISTMDRLFLAELLPDVDRVVYIDIDTIVLGDIADLAAFEPSPIGLAARPTPNSAAKLIGQSIETRARGMTREAAAEFRLWAAANVDLRTPFFNAGVLCLSLDRARRSGLFDRALALVERFGVHDQDALNLACAGDFSALPWDWNAMPYEEWFERANLIHWVGNAKPWTHGRSVRHARFWKTYGEDAPVPVGSPGHWRDPASYPAGWEARAKIAARWIEAPARVMDIGCGARMSLKSLIPEGCTYAAADMRAWTPDVQAIDLNAGQFPAGEYDVVTFLGVLEYLEKPFLALMNARRQAHTLIVSYCHPLHDFNMADRRAMGWINAIREALFVEKLEQMGWSIVGSETFSEDEQVRQIVYRASARERKEPAQPGLPIGRSVALAARVRAERLTYLRPEKMDRLIRTVVSVLSRGVRGDVAEFGVALGGSGIVLADYARRRRRRFFGYDVFATIPPPTSEKDGPDARTRYDVIAAGQSKGIRGDVYYGYRPNLLGEVTEAFDRHGVPVDGVSIRLVEGLFEDTVAGSGIGTLAFAHIDCDWYDPVRHCLTQVAARLSVGGAILIDDYHDWSGCKAAVDEFLESHRDFEFEAGANPVLRRTAHARD